MNKFKITIDGNNYDVTVNLTDHHKANVEGIRRHHHPRSQIDVRLRRSYRS